MENKDKKLYCVKCKNVFDQEDLKICWKYDECEQHLLFSEEKEWTIYTRNGVKKIKQRSLVCKSCDEKREHYKGAWL